MVVLHFLEINTKETCFSLTYDKVAVHPPEILDGSLQVTDLDINPKTLDNVKI